MSFLDHRNQRNYRTICEALREIKNTTKNKKVIILSDECIDYAKRMSKKLKWYKDKYGGDPEKEIFRSPTKETFEKRTLFGIFINYWDIGVSKVIGRFNSGISLILSVVTLLAVYGFKSDLLFVFVMGACFFCGTLFSGYLYKRMGYFDKEVHRATQINPYYKESINLLYSIDGKLRIKDKK